MTALPGRIANGAVLLAVTAWWL